MIVAHLARVAADGVPAEARAAAKVFIADTLAVGIAGARAPWRAQVLDMARGGPARSRPSGAAASACRSPPRRWSTPSRPMRRSSTPVHEGAVVHAMAAVLACALGWAEREGGVSGEALIRAVIAGVDVAATLGLCSRAPMRFFRPANCGGFGAVAALALLAGLDETQTRDALGIYYGECAGTMQAHIEASPQLAMQMGFAARNAVAAVELARRGMPGPRAPISGPVRLFRAVRRRGRPGAVRRARPRLAHLRTEPQAVPHRPRHAWRHRRAAAADRGARRRRRAGKGRPLSGAAADPPPRRPRRPSPA